MPFLLAGLIVLALLVFMGRGYVSANPKNLFKGMRFSGGLLLTLLTIALLFMDRVAFAFLTAAGAWFLFFGTAPPWWVTINPAPGGGGRSGGQSESRGGRPPAVSMSRAEALKVLGLQEGAGEEEIRAAHRRLIIQNHPDKGGTSYLASKINEAKDVLLRGR
jgi:DnaJ-like protein